MTNIEKNVKTLMNLFNTGHYDLLISKCKKFIKQSPEYLILYNILGSAYQRIGNLALAENIYTKAIKKEPGNIVIMNNLANVYKDIGKIELSEDLFNKIIKKNPNYVNAYVNFGNLKRDNNEFNLAIDLYKEALKINDKIPLIYYSLALAYQGLGKFSLAVKFAEKTLELDPKFTQADMLISQSIKYDEKTEHYKRMKHKINNFELNENQKINLFFAIAKANEDKDEIKSSFESFEQGNLLMRKLINFDINKEINFFNHLKKIFREINILKISKENFERKKIIFILGMPRSGTSLVEQVISSHSNVFGAGELPHLSRIIGDKLLVNGLISVEKIKKLIENQSYANEFREDYHNYLKRFDSTEPFITDKAPLNFRWIGIIKILFPSSKIIHCSRNPKDNCLSLYKNFFEGGLNFTYNQKELGTYYNLYIDLMNFWKKLFSNSIYNVRYEKMIQNPQDEIKNIINFCDLGWEESCLSFYKNKNPIKTLSTAQARKPIYKSSVNSFEKFESFLGDLNKII